VYAVRHYTTGTFRVVKEMHKIRVYLAQIGVALEYMHGKYNIVHRDLKPENVLLDEQGFCAIVDFNMAAKCDKDMLVPNPNRHIVGTLPYTAPELLERKDHTNKVDYWSLGIMVYEFAYGHRPFKIKSKGTFDKRHMLSTISNTKISSILDNSVSDDLNDLLRGLLRKNPTKRFGAEEFKNHKFLKGIDWDAVCEKRIEAPFLPREDRINFKPDAYVEEIFGLSKPNEEVDVMYSFEDWDWTSEDQELPPPNPKLLKKLNKKKYNRQPPKKEIVPPLGCTGKRREDP